MRKYVLVPDSFKGSISSSEICAIMKERILSHDPHSTVVSIPVADGGEGTVDCFLEAMEGERVHLDVCGPFLGERMNVCYALINGGSTAVIELAACSGLPLVEGRADPSLTTTFGVGEMILHAAKSGVSEIIVGLGGSATNDAGCGAAAALGVRFYDESGEGFTPTGGSLSKVASISMTDIDPCLKDVHITAMCDIDNPMFGPAGAAAVFGPQKGADEDMVKLLDDGLRSLSSVIKKDLGRDVSLIPGTGAAGAMGAGMCAFMSANIKMGIETVLDEVGFDDIIKDADIVFTGEGKIDNQSLRGKVVIGVARRAKNIAPVIAVVGDIGDDIESAYDEGVSGIISINRVAVDFKKARLRSKSDLGLTMDNFMRMYLTFKAR